MSEVSVCLLNEAQIAESKWFYAEKKKKCKAFSKFCCNFANGPEPWLRIGLKEAPLSLFSRFDPRFVCMRSSFVHIAGTQFPHSTSHCAFVLFFFNFPTTAIRPLSLQGPNRGLKGALTHALNLKTKKGRRKNMQIKFYFIFLLQVINGLTASLSQQ